MVFVLARVMSCAVVGLEGAVVEVQATILQGMPSFSVVGLPDTAVQEARERVRAAVKNSGYQFPYTKIIVNLAPADLKKAGPVYDLPIALSIVLSSRQASADVSNMVFLGELALDGTLRHTAGVLPMVSLARDQGFSKVVVPEVDAREASLIKGIQIVPMTSLSQLIACLKGELPEPQYQPDAMDDYVAPVLVETDLAYIKGQEHVKRALEVAAAGAHNTVMTGPPGSGKTLLAHALPSILPPMTDDETIEVTKIYSVSGLLPSETPLMRHRPFRAPHYTISNAGLVGGGTLPKPGEISLSHRGVLFLDELPEFGHALLESLRQPIEDKVVTISRAQGTVRFPANFMLVGAMNPCPCGYYGDRLRQCTCPPHAVSRYQRRVSGPFIDRIDIFVEVPHIEYEKLSDDRLSEKSEKVQQRVVKARERQLERFKGTGLLTNSEMAPAQVRDFCKTEEAAQSLLKSAMKQLYLSARAFHRTLKLARTIADLDDADIIKAHHLAEAIQYRPRTQIE
jgi:magnesium chelatase family protein